MKRVIQSLLKTSPKYLLGFFLCELVIAMGTYYVQGTIAPKDVFILAAIFIWMDIVSTIELSISKWNKWMKLPYWIKKLITLPLIMSVVVVGITNIGQIDSEIKLNGIYALIIGVIVYIISSFIKYRIEKRSTDEMNEALLILQKEIEIEDEVN